MAEVLDFDELNVLENNVDEMVEDIGGIIDDPNRTAIIGEIEDDLEELLIMAYIFGQDYVNRKLGTDVKATAEEMEDTVFQKIDGEDWRDRIRQHIEEGDLGMVKTVIRTESNRVYNTAVGNSVDDSGETDVQKTWVTMGDEKVRDTHWHLEGVKVPYGEKFYAIDGDSATAPGRFTMPENNINCRCTLRISK
jgi:hypothetical protein